MNTIGLVFSADNLCKQFGPRSGPTEDQAQQNVGPYLDQNCLTLMVFLTEFFRKVYCEKNQTTKKS